MKILEGDQAKGNGPLRVTVSGLTGRVCSKGWDDNAANVVCKEQGFKRGVAYQLSTMVSYFLFITL